MKCRKARVKISAWQDCELGTKEISALSDHLGKCASCRREAREMKSILENIPGPDTGRLSPVFTSRLLERIEAEKTARGFVFYAPRPVRSLVLACGVILLLVTSYSAGYGVGQGLRLRAVPTENMFEAYRSVLDLPAIDGFPEESVGRRYSEFFNGGDIL